MKKILQAASLLSLFTSVALCAKLPTNQVRGEYIEARTADVYTGPCFANSEIGLAGNLAVMGWKIEKGSYDGVSLDGLSVMGVVRAEGTLGDYARTDIPAKAILIIDDHADAEQRLALKSFAQRMGAGLLADVVRVDYRSIQFSMQDNNVHSMKAVMQAGELAKLETRPLSERDQICHNESVWYQPLTKVDHAMPAYTVANGFSGSGLGTSWNYSGNRGSFVGTFQLND
jgi:hypothetical protein